MAKTITVYFKTYFLIALLLVFSTIGSNAVLAGVSTTKHNLSVSGPGEVKAVTETGVCVFCHTPHNASPVAPLWNHELTSYQNYINYYSDTLVAYPPGGAPPIDGYSRLCLSCHDGTIGIGATIGRKGIIDMDTIPNVVESGRLNPGSPGYIGTDLSGGHPISFIFDEALVSLRNAEEGIMHLNWPILDQDVQLYPTQGGYGVQCTSCHEPHGGKGGPGAPPFWRKTAYDDVCLVCHNTEDILPQVGH